MLWELYEGPYESLKHVDDYFLRPDSTVFYSVLVDITGGPIMLKVVPYWPRGIGVRTMVYKVNILGMLMFTTVEGGINFTPYSFFL